MTDNIKIKIVTYGCDDEASVFITKGSVITELNIGVDLLGYIDLDALESAISKIKQSLLGKG